MKAGKGPRGLVWDQEGWRRARRAGEGPGATLACLKILGAGHINDAFSLKQEIRG